MPDRFLLLSDLPVESQESDLLGTAQIAVDLAELVHGSRDNTPFVLAIDGPWGAGKSSLMKQLSRALQEREVEIVWFNAWTACWRVSSASTGPSTSSGNGCRSTRRPGRRRASCSRPR